MKKCSYLLLILIPVLMSSCTVSTDSEKTGDNPFFKEYNTLFQVPPFEEIQTGTYIPAFKEGIEQQKKEINSIVSNPEAPTFENTIEAMEYSGTLLNKVSNVFFNLNSSLTNDEMQAIAKEMAPVLAQHRDDIMLNPELFERVKKVYEQKDEIRLSAEQDKLLEELYKRFVRGGANLNEEDQAKLREINKEVSVLTVQFAENLLAETNDFKLVIEKEEDLAGLPESVVTGAAETATGFGHEGKWVFTLQKPSMIPFLQYSGKRELREKIFKAYINRGDNDNDHDNKAILSKIASLRVERAHVLGYKTHADFVLEKNMAKTPDEVYTFLHKLMDAALPIVKNEANALQEMIEREEGGFKLEPWDWWYYAEKLKKEKYELDDEILRPYFELGNVRKGAFNVATKLFGLQFIEKTDIPKYHEEVIVFEVLEKDGSHVGILYMDFFPRASKRVGAWMSSFRKQYRKDGEEIHPVITTNFNFSKPSGDKPALLTFEEVSTLFHEFGHALHGLLSDCTYRSLSGTAVPRDFVELPSQIMENWASEPEVMKFYALHYETGEPIPGDLIDKIKKSRHFNQGFITVEYLSAAFLDMDWHTLTQAGERDPLEFETEAMERIKMIPEIVVRYRSPYFAHVFSGGYSSGYYSYIWAEVLDSDAFEAFKETSLFDQATAEAFRKNILSRGGTEDPMKLYLKFRGKEPGLEPLLKKRGLL